MSPPAKTTEEGGDIRARERTEEFRALVLKSRSEKDDSDDKEEALLVRAQRKDDDDSYAILLSKEVSKAALNAQMLARTTSRAIKRDQLNVYFNFDEKEDAKKEQIRDSIEREIVECVREMQNHVNRCEEIIKNGETKMMREESLRRSFGQKKRQQFVAHLHGIALITSEKIEEVAKTLDWMRARRFREQAEKAKRLERRRGGDARVGVEAVAKDLMMVKKQTAMPARRRTIENSNGSGDDVGEGSTRSSERRQNQQQQRQEFVNDSDALVAELVEVSRGTQRAESKIVELSALSSMFANVVSKQSQQIEKIYTEALKTTKFLDVGNVEMRKTISRRRSGSNYMAFVLFIATFAVLFLDWFND